ncbi:MAG: hypothetical protein CUN55_00825 [Phototrophicales bacterium]|nr:MAG: hypothetical protein CUN55_00825 [Phototrophicales bacterium]
MFSPGQTIGNYQLQNLIGRGGMGAVYQALDLRLQRIVAVKVMQPEVAQHEELRQRFIQEARAAAALNHPNIVRVFEFHADANQLYLVMELVQGGSLRDYLNKMEAQNYVMHVDEATYIMQQACTALYYAHSQGMIHRDIKPDNVLLKPNPIPGGMPYTIVLTDFGLAKLVDAQNLVKTQLNRPLGTLPYMAPEQFRGETDKRSDIYALGIMFYELLTGRLPFLPKNMAEAMTMHQTMMPTPPSQIRPDLPPHIEPILMKALAKSPEERFQTAAEFGKALAPEAAHLFSTPKPPVAPIAHDSPKPQVGRVAEGEQFTEDTIIVVTPQGQIYRRIPIRKTTLLVGRDPNLDIPLPGDKVSRRHLKIERQPDGKFIVVDLGSSNGSFLAGAKLVKDVAEPWPPEQELIIGEFSLQLYKATAARSEINKTQIAGGGVVQQPSSQAPAASGKGHVGGTQIFDAPADYGGGKNASSGSGQQYGGYYQAPAQQYPAQHQPYPAQPPYNAHQAPPRGPGANAIRVTVDPEQVTVEAGGVANAIVSVYNTSNIVKHCRLRIYGLDQEWFQIPPTTLQLLPDEGGEFSILLKPPRQPTSTAGQHIFDIRVLDEKMEVIGWGQGILVVKPYYEFSIELEPEIIRKRGLVWLTIHNEGNARDSYIVRGRDKEDGLRFYHDPAPLIIDPLTKVAVEIEVRPKSRLMIGGSKMYQYELEVNTASNLEKAANGQLISPPLLPIWILPLFMLLCLCLLLLLLFLLFRPKDEPTIQAAATPTATVDVGPLTDFLTATANSFQNAVIPTATARIEATFASDVDGDGLTYLEELEAGTLPDLADSDGDQLDDGFELKESKTNPRERDTDGDGLSDRAEVEDFDTNPNEKDTDDDDLDDATEVSVTYGEQGLKTDPNNPDTDGDGIKDGVEVREGSDPTSFASRPIVPTPG